MADTIFFNGRDAHEERPMSSGKYTYDQDGNCTGFADPSDQMRHRVMFFRGNRAEGKAFRFFDGVPSLNRPNGWPLPVKISA
jgi:hypothetical protein